jgi:RNA polymerase sigma-70 factor (ECF subfamily)
MTSRMIRDDVVVVDLHKCSDHELVSLLADQDEHAFGELFQRHARSIRGTSLTILGASGHCDDVVTEVFLALWLTPDMYDPTRGSLLGFLRLKARGKSIDIIRSETARRRRERAEAITQQPRDNESEAESERTQEVEQALASLPANEREPIELGFQLGMTYREIAVYLGDPEGTTKSRIRSGLQRLRKNLEEQGLVGSALSSK